MSRHFPANQASTEGTGPRRAAVHPSGLTAQQSAASQLEDLPNIGKSIAADLRAIGILTPQQLAQRDPLATYHALSTHMGRRHDPCVLYTLLAAHHYLDSGEAIPWWRYTAYGKQLLARYPR